MATASDVQQAALDLLKSAVDAANGTNDIDRKVTTAVSALSAVEKLSAFEAYMASIADSDLQTVPASKPFVNLFDANGTPADEETTAIDALVDEPVDPTPVAAAQAPQ